MVPVIQFCPDCQVNSSHGLATVRQPDLGAIQYLRCDVCGRIAQTAVGPDPVE